MTTTRKQYTPKFKARVALEAIRGERKGEGDDDDTKAVQSEVQGEGSAGGDPRRAAAKPTGFSAPVHPVQIGHWRKAAIEQMAELFVDGRKRKPRDGEVEKEALFEEIGRLKVELDWLKNKVGLLD